MPIRSSLRVSPLLSVHTTTAKESEVPERLGQRASSDPFGGPTFLAPGLPTYCQIRTEELPEAVESHEASLSNMWGHLNLNQGPP